MKYVSMSSGIAIAWLPNSLLLAFFLLKDNKEWKFYIPFFILAEIVADYSSFTIIQSLQFAFINIFETTFAAFFIKKLSGNYKLNFSNIKYVIVFFLIALNIMPSISAILGASVYTYQIVDNGNFFEFWRIWYFGDAVGILLLTPIIVILIENYKSLEKYSFSLQNILTIFFTLVLVIVLFSFDNKMIVLPTTPLIFILILLWIVYKQGMLPALIISFLISIISIYYTINSIGPFAIFAEKETTIFLQEFISLLVIIPLFVGALLSQIAYANEKLVKLNIELEDKVKEKTKFLQESNKKLSLLASKDPLTNIYNRRMINDYIKKETAKAKRHKTDLSLILLDIDHFKDTNDTFGHQVGDEVLIEISKLISTNIRKSDIFGRWGGEEFIIILPNTNIINANEVAQNLREKVQNHTFDKIGQKTISIGLSMFDYKQDILEFIENADNAMYKAKYNGRNKVEY